jgi:hypothetical protein
MTSVSPEYQSKVASGLLVFGGEIPFWTCTVILDEPPSSPLQSYTYAIDKLMLNSYIQKKSHAELKKFRTFFFLAKRVN